MVTSETITREDLILFINACFACTAQREFYSTAEEQRVSLDFLHRYVVYNYRRLYARSLAAGINHFNQAEIIKNLLASGKQTPAAFRSEENALITASLRALPPQRAWKLIEQLRRAGVNNRRTRGLIKTFLAERSELSFEAVKYRRKVRAAAIHAHLELPGEVGRFLFAGNKSQSFETRLFEQFRQAHHSKEAIYELPFTVAEGLAAKHGISREVFLERIAPKLSSRERLRLQGATDGKLELQPERLSLTALALYVLSLPISERFALEPLLVKAARRTAHIMPPLNGKIAAVLDNSYSASGSSEKRRRPLGVALAVHYVLSSVCENYQSFWTNLPKSALAVLPRGQTNLTERMLDALEWGAEYVVIVSDACENDPPGVFEEIYRGYLAIGNATLIHLNPVFDAEMLNVRSLSPLIPSVGLRDAEDLPTALSFARIATRQGTIAELESYLEKRVQSFLEGATS